MIADRLTRQGIAVLRMDDRGTGKSGAAMPTHLATRCHGYGMCLGLSSPTERHPTRKDRTGGHSMGGTIAFRMAAQRPQDVAFVLSLAGAPFREKT